MVLTVTFLKWPGAVCTPAHCSEADPVTVVLTVSESLSVPQCDSHGGPELPRCYRVHIDLPRRASARRRAVAAMPLLIGQWQRPLIQIACALRQFALAMRRPWGPHNAGVENLSALSFSSSCF